MEDRLIELETRVAFQDDTIQALSEVCARQQEQIDRISLVLEKLQKQVRDMAPTLIASESEETPPPHY